MTLPNKPLTLLSPTKCEFVIKVIIEKWKVNKEAAVKQQSQEEACKHTMRWMPAAIPVGIAGTQTEGLDRIGAIGMLQNNQQRDSTKTGICLLLFDI